MDCSHRSLALCWFPRLEVLCLSCNVHTQPASRIENLPLSVVTIMGYPSQCEWHWTLQVITLRETRSSSFIDDLPETLPIWPRSNCGISSRFLKGFMLSSYFLIILLSHTHTHTTSSPPLIWETLKNFACRPWGDWSTTCTLLFGFNWWDAAKNIHHLREETFHG